MKINAYVLSYASHTIDGGRDSNYVECCGVFNDEETAKSTMDNNVENDIADGYLASNFTKTSDTSWSYVNDVDEEQKEYKVERMKMDFSVKKQDVLQLKVKNYVGDYTRASIWGNLSVQEANDLFFSLRLFSSLVKVENYVHDVFERLNKSFDNHLEMRKVKQFDIVSWEVRLCDWKGITTDILSFYTDEVKVSID